MKGLYIHIPFCVKKCAYCDFYSLPDRLDLIDAYIDILLLEAKAYLGMTFETLYLGGGTPSLISVTGIKRLFRALNKTFDLSNLTEATIEVNPESATSELYCATKESGINRVSIGVQSLSDSELKSVGRIHAVSQAISAVVKAKKAGFSEISCDALVGLPGQNWRSLSTTLRKLVGLGISHFSLYCLSLEENTPLGENPPSNLPSEDMQAELFERSRRLLVSHGFCRYEISNFALEGHECQHNLNYWRGGEYLGLGTAAASHINNRRFRNKSDLDAYLTNPTGQMTELEELNAEDKASEEAMLRLRLIQEGLDIKELSLKFGEANMRRLRQRLEALAREGLLIFEDSKYRLPHSKVLVSNQILARVIGD